MGKCSVMSFDTELLELVQKTEETLTSYYNRTINLMQKHGAKDRTEERKLSVAKLSLCYTVLAELYEKIASDIALDAHKYTQALSEIIA